MGTLGGLGGPRGVFPGAAGRLGAPGELKGQHPSASHAAEGVARLGAFGRFRSAAGAAPECFHGAYPGGSGPPDPAPGYPRRGPAEGNQRWPGIRRGVRATGKGVACLLLPYLLTESEFALPGGSLALPPLGLPCPPPPALGHLRGAVSASLACG